jgi:hypothetical protein
MGLQALVLANLLIAMMNTTYSSIQEKNQQVCLVGGNCLKKPVPALPLKY